MKKARDIMTREVISVTSETSIRDLAEIFTGKCISGVPVLDEENNVVGIVTESDLIFQNKKISVPAVFTILDSFIFLDSPDKMEQELKKIAAATVGDICSAPPVTITPDTPLDEIATLMIERRIHTLPVVDTTGTMVGIVGKKDIIRTIL